MDNSFDVIIIGAGLGGLTAASILAKNNIKTLIIEKHNKVGGFATNFKRKNFIFDVSLHNLQPLSENELVTKFLKEIGIFDKLEYIKFTEFQRIIFPEHDIVIKNDVNNFINDLKLLYPEEKDGIEKIFNEIRNIKLEFDEINNLEITIDKIINIYPLLPLKFPSLLQYVDVTFQELLNKFVQNDKLKGLISNLWWLYGTPPDNIAAIPYAIPAYNYINHGGGYIKGTSQKLSDAITETIKDKNGSILLNTAVKEIIIENEKTIGIKTDNNEIYYADKIISNISPSDTFFNLINKIHLSPKFIKKVLKYEISPSGLQLYLGLDCNPSILGIQNPNITVFTSYDHNKNYEYMLNSDYDNIFLSCTNYTAFDKNLAPEGKGILNILTLDNFKNWENLSKLEYESRKNKVAEVLINRLKKYYKDIDKHIEVSELATPVTIHKYTNSPEGTIYGLSQIISQAGLNRLTGETPVKGLFMAGSNVYPGAGYSSVINSGYKIAKNILSLIK